MSPVSNPAEGGAGILNCLWQRRAALLLGLALLVTIAGPFALRSQHAGVSEYDRRLVILSPHNERVRQAFSDAFTHHWQRQRGERLYLDWRLPGGSSEIARFLQSEYRGAFQHLWRDTLNRPWSHAVESGFADPRLVPDSGEGASDNEALRARRAFLESSLGIGVDLLFGGGAYDFNQLAEAGYLVAGDARLGIGPRAVTARHPQWFSDALFPQRFGGEWFRDPRSRWLGAVLSTFGILYNRDSLKRLGIGAEPRQWADLARPEYFAQIALADPNMSGSVAKAFELMVQQPMHQALARSRIRNPSTADESAAIREGWLEGLRLIQRISANARYFTDASSKIGLAVSRGDAAAGMSIDSYGRAALAYVHRADGRSRLGFVAPLGGTSVSVDPIALLRGAREPELATAFIEFVLSPAGQKLFAYRPGVVGGPEREPLYRLPLRRDLYTLAHRPWMTDPESDPYQLARRFDYRAAWTGPLFGALRFIIRVLCVEVHEEQQSAWRAIIERGMPADALAIFHDLEGLDYDRSLTTIAPLLRSGDKVGEIHLARRLADRFRRQYRLAHDKALGTEG